MSTPTVNVAHKRSRHHCVSGVHTTTPLKWGTLQRFQSLLTPSGSLLAAWKGTMLHVLQCPHYHHRSKSAWWVHLAALWFLRGGRAWLGMRKVSFSRPVTQIYPTEYPYRMKRITVEVLIFGVGYLWDRGDPCCLHELSVLWGVPSISTETILRFHKTILQFQSLVLL